MKHYFKAILKIVEEDKDVFRRKIFKEIQNQYERNIADLNKESFIYDKEFEIFKQGYLAGVYFALVDYLK